MKTRQYVIRQSTLPLLALILLSLTFASVLRKPTGATAACNIPFFNLASHPTVNAPIAIATDDFNKDGKPDVVAVSNRITGTASVFLGTGDGNFSSPTTLSGLRNPQSVATGDLNGDGNPDIVVGNTSANTGELSIFLGNGTGGFSGPTQVPLVFGQQNKISAVAIGDFNGDGKPDIGAASSTFSSISILIGNGSGGFTFLRSLSSGGGVPAALSARDLNGDGKLDLIVGNANTNGNVSVLLGDGAGNFASAANFVTHNYIVSIAIADFDGDGKLDIVAASFTPGKVYYLHGDGSGAFTNSSTFALNDGGSVSAVRAGDFNGDGKLDFAILTPGDSLLIYLGDGTGGFTLSANFVDLVGGSVDGNALAVADLNQDMRPDIVFGNQFQSRLSAFVNSCGASASPQLQFNVAGVNVSEDQGTAGSGVVRIGDITGSSSVDYFTTNGTAVSPGDYLATSGSLSFGPGDFAKGINVTITDDNVTEPLESFNLTITNAAGATLSGPSTIPVTIIDNDPPPAISINDVSVTEGDSGTSNAAFKVMLDHPSSQTITVNYATADNLAKAGSDYQSTSGTLTFAPGDLSRDLLVPVIADTAPEINETFFVNLTNPVNGTIADSQGMATIVDDDSSCPSASFGTPKDITLATSPFDIVAGDFNGDGKVDQAVANRLTNSVSLMLGDGNGSFGSPTTFQVGGTPNAITAADLNVDGKLDLIVTNNANNGDVGSISILLGNGTGSFAAATNIQTVANVRFTAVGDFNRDGKPDLAVATATPSISTNSVAVLLGDGTGGFGTPTSYTTGLSSFYVATSDLNGDGKLDLVVSNQNSNNVSVLLGNGDGTFAPANNIAAGNAPQMVALADFNGDGKPDLFVPNIDTTSGASVLIGDGAGGFTLSSTLTFAIQPTRTYIADLNGDGRNDVVVTDPAIGSFPPAGAVWVLLGNGDGKFAQPIKFNAGNASVGSAIADFDRDGKLDMAIAVFGPAKVSLLVNSCSGSTLQFSAPTYNVSEGVGSAQVTVNRSGDVSLPVTVQYSTSDRSGGANCNVFNGNASARCDYISTLGTLRFAANESAKTISIPIVDDGYPEGNEAFQIQLANPTGALLASPSTANVVIADNDVGNGPNPIDNARAFVRQHYIDFLNREPDQSGLDFWTGQMTSCGSDTACTEVKRINVSAAFFLSIEFQQTGYLVERMYKTAYGDATGTSTPGGSHQLPAPVVRFNEFLKDTQRIGQGVVVLAPGWEQALENNKQAYAGEFVATSRFISAFPTTMTPTQFVDRLNTNAGNVLSASERMTAINLFNGAADSSNTSGRAQALRQVAEDQDLYSAEFNRAFVLTEFFGYLRRNPNDLPDSDYTGYEFWLTKLNQFNGDYIGAEMVKAFIASNEYRQRFGP
jgi:hypothetical protein